MNDHSIVRPTCSVCYTMIIMPLLLHAAIYIVVHSDFNSGAFVLHRYRIHGRSPLSTLL